jgi:hypothetical protein
MKCEGGKQDRTAMIEIEIKARYYTRKKKLCFMTTSMYTDTNTKTNHKQHQYPVTTRCVAFLSWEPWLDLEKTMTKEQKLIKTFINTNTNINIQSEKDITIKQTSQRAISWITTN